MSPLDMMIFLFIILVTVKAVTESFNYWREIDEEAVREANRHSCRPVNIRKAAVAAGVQPARSTRITPNNRPSDPVKRPA